MEAKMSYGFLLIVCGLSFSFGQTFEEHFPLKCPGKFFKFRTIPKRGVITLGDICGTNLDVSDFDVSKLGVAQLSASGTIRCSETETVYTTQKGLSTANFLEDLKSLTFDGLPVTMTSVPDKQEYCLLDISLTTTDTILHSQKMPVILIPDFETQRTDITILRDREPPAVVEVTDGNLKEAVAGYSHRVEYRNLIPLVNDACYYVTAFLRPVGHELPPHSMCKELVESETEDVFPYLELSDIVVAHKCIMGTTSSDGSTEVFYINSILQEKVPGICGNFELVFFADPFGTIYPENQRCDNYKNITVNLQCGVEEERPLCQMTTNIFDPQSVAFMMKGVKKDPAGMKEPYHSLYEVEFEPHSVAWVKSMETQDSYHGIKQRGFALIEVLWKTIMEHYSDVCENVADVKEILRDLEGLDSVEFPNVADSSFTGAYSLKDLDVTELSERKNAIPTDTPTTDFSTKINNAIMRKVLESLIKEKAASAMSSPVGTDMEGMDYEQPIEEIKVTEIMENVTKHGNMMSDEESLGYVKNLTGLLMHVKSKYSTNTCFNDVYDKVIAFIRHIKTGSVEFLGDFEALYDEKSVADFKKLTGMSSIPLKYALELAVNSCIKRIEGSIRNKCDMEEDFTEQLRKKVCLVNKFQTFIKEKAKALGISYIMRDLLYQRAMEKDMDISDPLVYRKGGYQIWTYDKGTFYQHVISPTYDKVCKRKMATCHCEVCDSDMGSGYGGDHGYSGSGMSGSGYEGTGMGNMGDEKGNTEDGMSGEGDGGSGSGSGSGFGEKLGNLGDNLPLKKRK